MKEKENDAYRNENSFEGGALYYCSKHGVMNKSTDLKEKVDQIAEKPDARS